MQDKILVENDLTVSLKKLLQFRTYSGMAEGYPNARLNRWVMENVERKAKSFCGMEQTYIIEPEQKAGGPLDASFREPWLELPEVACIAELWHGSTFRDREMDFSSLCVIWFQGDFAFPIDPIVLEKMKAIPFSKLCGEFSYM